MLFAVNRLSDARVDSSEKYKTEGGEIMKVRTNVKASRFAGRPDLYGYLGQPVADLQPATAPGNLPGFDETTVPELVLSPSAEQGYYLFVRPLSRGTHTIRWIASGWIPGFSQDVTYHLTVLGSGPNQ